MRQHSLCEERSVENSRAEMARVNTLYRGPQPTLLTEVRGPHTLLTGAMDSAAQMPLALSDCVRTSVRTEASVWAEDPSACNMISNGLRSSFT